MSLKKYLLFFAFLFLCSCAEYSKNNKTFVNQTNLFSSKGFALIYSDQNYYDKIVNRKIDNTKLVVGHSKLKKNTLIKIINPTNSKVLNLKISKNLIYPKVFNIVISKKVATSLELDLENPYVEIFEQKLADLCEVKFSVGVNSGTDALFLALQVLGIGPGDEVITAPNSFVSTASAIKLSGAIPRFVDVDKSYNIDTNQIEKQITNKTKAIIPVHLTGRPANMSPIIELSEKYNISVIEDAAQAIMAKYNNKPVGSIGHIGCFSFHPLKTLNACGDAGAITTNNKLIYEKLLTLRNLGLKNRNNCESWSINSRLDSIQASILNVKIKFIKEWTYTRRKNAEIYNKSFSNMNEIILPPENENNYSVYHTYVIQVEKRDELKQYLDEHGIGTAIHYPIPIHLQKVANELGYKEGSFPNAEKQSKNIISLPIYPELKNDDLTYIIQTIKRFYL